MVGVVLVFVFFVVIVAFAVVFVASVVVIVVLPRTGLVNPAGIEHCPAITVSIAGPCDDLWNKRRKRKGHHSLRTLIVWFLLGAVLWLSFDVVVVAFVFIVVLSLP